MTRWRDGQRGLGELILFGVVEAPETLMDPFLRRIDALLDDQELVGAVWRVMRQPRPQSARRGRPTTPAETMLRLLVLKHLKRWSYDQLEWEVRGNVVYRHFCRLGGGRVPDAKTLVRWGQLLDAPVLREVFDRVVALARQHDVTRGRRLRVDTTVVEAPIRYPTDSGLCEDSIRVLSQAMRAVAAAGVRMPVVVRNVRRSVTHRMREIAQGCAGVATLRSRRSSVHIGACCAAPAASCGRRSAPQRPPGRSWASWRGGGTVPSSGRWRCSRRWGRGRVRSCVRRARASCSARRRLRASW